MSSRRYRDFFVDSLEGQSFVKQLHDLIARNHQTAERMPESARDHTQRAKGIREVIDIISVLSIEKKEDKAKDS